MPMPSLVRPGNGGKAANIWMRSFVPGATQSPKVVYSKAESFVCCGQPSSAMTSRIVMPECTGPMATPGLITIDSLEDPASSAGPFEQLPARRAAAITKTGNVTSMFRVFVKSGVFILEVDMQHSQAVQRCLPGKWAAAGLRRWSGKRNWTGNPALGTGDQVMPLFGVAGFLYVGLLCLIALTF